MLRAGSATRRREIPIRISLADLLPSYFAVAGEPDFCVIEIYFSRDGTYSVGSNTGNLNVTYTYATPRSSRVGYDYEVQAETSSFGHNNGSLGNGVWAPLTNARTCVWEQVTLGEYAGTGVFSIRSARTKIILASITSYFSAEVVA